VRISRQILQDMLWAAKRWLGINHPVPVAEGGYELRKADRVGEFSNASIEAKAVRRDRFAWWSFLYVREMGAGALTFVVSPARRSLPRLFRLKR
jgi:hypothetical protein